MDTCFEEKLIDFAINSDIIISESTYIAEEQEMAKEYFHLTCIDAAKIAKESKSNNLILTHISQRYSNIPNIVKKETQNIFNNTIIAEDFDKIEF
jgi:ribonuclease Z